MVLTPEHGVASTSVPAKQSTRAPDRSSAVDRPSQTLEGRGIRQANQFLRNAVARVIRLV